METPDNWVVFSVKEDDVVVYKILAGWSGGYLYGNSWRVNSGIKKITENNDYYYVEGYSGSIYCLNKNSEIMRMNISPIWDALFKKYPDRVKLVKLSEIVSRI